MTTPEGIVKSQVLKALKQLESCGDIFYYERLNSGQFKIGDCYMHSCRAGTFDCIAVMPDKKKNLIVAFIEIKRSDKKAFLSETQKSFKATYDGKHANIHFWLVQSGAEVKALVRKFGYDRMNDVTM